MMSRIIALIPARGGSKGLPRKNLLPLQGEPLLSITVNAALGVPRITHTYVSTEDNEIKEVAKSSGAQIIPRPASLSLDDSTTDSVIGHTIDYLELTASDILVLLQATSPMRTRVHIEGALDLFLSQRPQLVMSVYKPNECIFKAFKQSSSGRLEAYFNADDPFKPRQSFEDIYFANGAIYIFTVGDFLLASRIPRSDIQPFFMGVTESVDIDHEIDLKYCAMLNEENIP